jgi:hypothetical protein
MLLGQIVAISFATNLYFLTLLLSAAQQTAPATSKNSAPEATRSAPGSKRNTWLGWWLVDGISTLTVTSAAELLSRETYWHGPGFMPVLMLLHVVLLIVPTARAILPARFFPEGEPRTVNKIYSSLLTFTFYFVGRLAVTTYKAYVAGTLGEILSTLLEHPAVSSVGFDVIFCWISWLCWWQTQGQHSSSYVSEL